MGSGVAACMLGTLAMLLAGCAGPDEARPNEAEAKDPPQVEHTLNFSHTGQLLLGSMTGIPPQVGGEYPVCGTVFGEGWDRAEYRWELARPPAATEGARLVNISMYIQQNFTVVGAMMSETSYWLPGPTLHVRIYNEGQAVGRPGNPVGFGTGYDLPANETVTWGQYRAEYRVCYGVPHTVWFHGSATYVDVR